MLADALRFLLDVLLQPFAAILLLRFHLQWLRAPLNNPVGAFIMALTNFLVLRTRRYIPAAGKLDSATLLLAVVAELLYLAAVLWSVGFQFHAFPWPGLLLLALVKLFKISVYLLMTAVFVQAIMSWINPYTPLTPLFAAVTGRFLYPLRRIIPLAGGVDLSPLALFIICQLIVMIPVSLLERLAFGLAGGS
ncbi:MAG TPA: YggT family protein [Gallionella sp.]|nr:YggT family protein [Gallionella sp.]